MKRTAGPHRYKHSGGFSIVELLAATAITGMLIVGLVAIFLNWRGSAISSDLTSQIEERGRRAFSEIVGAIQSSGFGGCSRAPDFMSSSVATGNDPRWDFLDSAIRGYDGKDRHWRPILGETIAPGAAANHDVLLLRRPRPQSKTLRLQDPMQSATDDLRIEPLPQSMLQVGDVAVISSCAARAYFVATTSTADRIGHEQGESRQASPSNRTDSLEFAFDVGAEIVPLQTTIFYVAPASGTDGALSLWRRTDNKAAVEIATHVHDLQFEYGIDLDNDGSVDEYRDADMIADWSQVFSVQVSLQLTIVARAERDAQIGGTRFATPSELSSNADFRATVAIRNRVPGNG